MSDDSSYLRKQASRRESRVKSQSLKVECPTCYARPTEPCGRESDKTRIVHACRVLAAVVAGVIKP